MKKLLGLLSTATLAGTVVLCTPALATRLFGSIDEDWHRMIRLAVEADDAHGQRGARCCARLGRGGRGLHGRSGPGPQRHQEHRSPRRPPHRTEQ